MRSVLLLLAAVAAAVLSPAPPGRAFFGGGGVTCAKDPMVIAQADRVIGATERRLAVLERSVVSTLTAQTGQLSAYTAQSAKAVATALDTQTKQRAQTEREALEVDSQLRHRPSRPGCVAVTGMRGLAGAGTAARRASAGASAAETGRIAADTSITAAPSPAADAAGRHAELLANYCAESRSPQRSAACTGDPSDHDADLRAFSLFGVPTFADDKQLRAAIELSRNLTVPVTYVRPALGAADTEAEQREVLLARSADARQGLAADALAHLRGLRAPGAPLGDWAAAMAPGRAGTGPVSRWEILAHLAAGRVEDPDHWVALQGMGEAGILREIAVGIAVSNLLAWERFRLAEREAALSAAALAHEVERARSVRPMAAAN